MLNWADIRIPCEGGGWITIGAAITPLGRRSGIYEAVRKAFEERLENVLAVEVPFVILPGGKSSGGTGANVRHNETREEIVRRVLGTF